MIRLSRPWMGEEEIDAARSVLESGMLVQGERVQAFERALAERCARKHAVVVSSGTTALELALRALGISDGDVLCPDLTWPSPAHAILAVGARPVLVDIDRESWNVSAQALVAARTKSTVAAIVIDQFGTPADHPAIARALDDLPIVVDAACSLGASVDGRPAASFGRVACLSFHPRKVITTGEGGACLTDDDALADALRVLRNHGQSAPGRVLVAAGNHRLTEMAAAVGLAQLARLDAILERRDILAQRYRAALAPSFGVQHAPASGRANYQTFGLTLPASTSREDRDRLVERLRAMDIEAGRLSYALHRLESLPACTGSFPVAEHVDDRGLALPLHPLLESADQDRVLSGFESAVRALGIVP